MMPNYSMGGFLTDLEINDLQKDHNMLEPYCDHQENLIENGYKLPSHGLSCCSYDLRLDNLFKIYEPTNPYSNTRFLPKNVVDIADPESIKLQELKVNKFYTLAPGGFCLAKSIERFKLPSNIMAQVADKSTWARLGIFLQNTLIDPGFEGDLTLEISNGNPYPVKLYVGCGIAQVLFFRLNLPVNKPYDSKYQLQKGVTGPQSKTAD